MTTYLKAKSPEEIENLLDYYREQLEEIKKNGDTIEDQLYIEGVILGLGLALGRNGGLIDSK